MQQQLRARTTAVCVQRTLPTNLLYRGILCTKLSVSFDFVSSVEEKRQFFKENEIVTISGITLCKHSGSSCNLTASSGSQLFKRNEGFTRADDIIDDQYTLAADRQNPALAELCDTNREPILRMIELAAKAIHHTGGWIGICGEMAADLHLTQRWANLGIDELSVSVPYLLGVREKVSECK